MTHPIDPSVQEKLLPRRDRAKVEAKLSEYPLAAQKRWVANPMLEFLLQSYTNSLIGGITRSPTAMDPAKKPNEPKETPKESQKASGKPDKDASSDDEGEAMFDLFG